MFNARPIAGTAAQRRAVWPKHSLSSGTATRVGTVFPSLWKRRCSGIKNLRKGVLQQLSTRWVFVQPRDRALARAGRPRPNGLSWPLRRCELGWRRNVLGANESRDLHNAHQSNNHISARKIEPAASASPRLFIFLVRIVSL